MSNLPYEGATAEQLNHPLVNQFLAIHDMFRDQLQEIVEYVDDLLSGEVQLSDPQTKARVQALIRAGTQYTHYLHFHHHAETDTLFPALQKEGLESAIVDKLNADHDEIGALIDKFSDAIRNLAAVEPEVMNNDLRRLSDALRAHLAYEESHVCPLMVRWTHFPGH
jgi:iron-sulfur cluster repair protein YtfE (RIC family)